MPLISGVGLIIISYNITMKRKTIKKILLILIAVSAICWDLATSYQTNTTDGTFRYIEDFDAISSETVKVGIVPSDYQELSDPIERSLEPTYEQIEEMVREAIELQGGLDWIIDPNDVVMIKVNLVGENSPSGEGENTDVRVVKALMKIIHEHTEGNVTIQIAEGTARTNDDISDSESVWGNSGYLDLLTDSALSDINFSLLNLNQSINDLVEVDLEDKGTSAPQGTKYHIHKTELEANVYIAVPVLKIHDTGITNALKLQIGTAPGCYYGYNKTSGTSYSDGIYHDIEHRRWTTEAIVDLSTLADIDLVVVDALMCLETYKTYKGDNQVRMNTIVAGADPVAVDHVCAKLFYLNPNDIAHITLAELIGLGTNNPDNIILKGADINDVKKQVKKNQSENGLFGQSNRIWILSESFDGTDIDQEYIANEASLEPAANNNGWSKPVYFFDDRIDLGSFYDGKTDIVTYAFTYFDSPNAQTAELWLGNQEGIKVYLNDEEVYSYSSTKVYSDDDIGEKVKNIELNEGQNKLLVKTLNRFGDYSFALNICEVESNSLYKGNRVDGLIFYTPDESTPINESQIENQIILSAFPNPAKDKINLQFAIPVNSECRICIFDINGRLVYEEKLGYFTPGKHQYSWNLETEKGQKILSGLYICQLLTKESVNSIRLIISD